MQPEHPMAGSSQRVLVSIWVNIRKFGCAVCTASLHTSLVCIEFGPVPPKYIALPCLSVTWVVRCEVIITEIQNKSMQRSPAVHCLCRTCSSRKSSSPVWRKRFRARNTTVCLNTEHRIYPRTASPASPVSVGTKSQIEIDFLTTFLIIFESREGNFQFPSPKVVKCEWIDSTRFPLTKYRSPLQRDVKMLDTHK